VKDEEEQQKSSPEEEELRQIAAEVKARSGSAVKPSRSHGKRGFLRGALSGIAVAAAVPLLAPKPRPAARGVIKGGIARNWFGRSAAIDPVQRNKQ
jgi:hypothetical protein